MLPVMMSLQGQWVLAALECKMEPLMGRTEQGPKNHEVQQWDMLKGEQHISSKLLQHIVLLLSLLPLSFGLHPTPCLHFCAMG